MLTATAIRHGFGGAPILDGVDFALAPGEVVGLVGPSGAGKTTLGRILAGHLRPTSGRVDLTDAPKARASLPAPVQYAPQASELSVDPRWRVRRILANGGVPDPEAFRLLGVREEWFDRFPAELSGGELARVSLARLLLPTTRYLVCDEVTAPLDALAANALATALRDLARAGLGIVLISHNVGLVQRHADRTVSLPVRSEHTGDHGERRRSGGFRAVPSRAPSRGGRE